MGRPHVLLLLAQLSAIVGYLIPVATLVLLRMRRDRPLWALALDLPLAVSLDLLTILGLTLFGTLEHAVLLSRACWIAGGLVVWWRGRPRPALPDAVTRPVVWSVAVATVGATALSLWRSRPYAIWDRQWHIPLVASLRGQRLPFVNVFDQASHGVLHYHFAGDVLAAVVQTLSFDTLHASLALSLVHDILFGLTAAGFTLLVLALTGGRRAWAGPCAVLLLLHGPVASSHPSCAPQSLGYSWLSFFEMSFRPHVSLAGLLFIGVLGAVAVRLMTERPSHQGGRSQSTTAVLLLSATLLGITDEASAGLCGLVLGLVWIVFPEAIHPRRWVGLVVLAVFALGVLLANRVFSASLVGGGPVQKLAIVPWRTPGYIAPPVALWTRPGLTALTFDLLPIALVWLGLLLLWFRTRARALAAFLVFLAVLAPIATVLLTRVELNGVALESHRFMSLLGFSAAFFALLLLPGMPPRSLALGLVLVAVLASSLSTLGWARAIAPASSPRDFAPGALDVHWLDCRESTGSQLGEETLPAYVASDYLYLFTGCHPTFVPGQSRTQWPMSLEPAPTARALHILRGSPSLQSGPMLALCPATGTLDAVCKAAHARGLCAKEGSLMLRCTLPPGDRLSILAGKP
jgi:hypothetical protein